jgi:hypothetical protein
VSAGVGFRSVLSEERATIHNAAAQAAIDQLVAQTTPADEGAEAPLSELDAASQQACGFGVTDMRLTPFAGIQPTVPHDDGTPGFVVATDGQVVEALDSADGHVIAVIADPIAHGTFEQVALTSDGTELHFVEDLRDDASTTAAAIWRVPLAGGRFEMVRQGVGLSGIQLSDDGWIATAWRQSGDDTQLEIVNDAGGGVSGAATSLGPWLAVHHLASPMDRDGRSGVGIVDVDNPDNLVHAVPDRFFPAPIGARWIPLAVRPSDEAIVVAERCCGAQPTSTRLLLIDELSGAVLQDITRPAMADGSSTLTAPASAPYCAPAPPTPAGTTVLRPCFETRPQDQRCSMTASSAPPGRETPARCLYPLCIDESRERRRFVERAGKEVWAALERATPAIVHALASDGVIGAEYVVGFVHPFSIHVWLVTATDADRDALPARDPFLTQVVSAVHGSGFPLEH